ncbi:MAG: LamG-like jellyroll fold domain-containing protein [Candidatus Falkowbacteria bacterium]
MPHKKRSAFTLIELLVVIAIIGILATIAVVALQNARAKARDARRVADVKQTQTALELFFNDQQRYPSADEFNSGSLYSTSINGTTTYMAIIPTPPTPADGPCTSVNNGAYYYLPVQNGTSYSISYCVGGSVGALTSGAHCATPAGINDGTDCTLASCSGLGMVSYWRGENNANDAHSLNNGTLMNGATFAPGKVGQAFSFDGVNDYVDLGNFITSYPQFTFSFWVKVNSYPDPNYMTPFCQAIAVYPPSSRNFCVYTSTSADSSGFEASWTDGTYLNMRTTIAFGSGIWNHVVVTYDGSNVKQYLNSVLVNTGAYSAKSIGNANSLLIGKGYAYPGYLATTYFSGLVDEVAVSNRALNLTEIQGMYNNSLAGNAYCAY